MTIAISTDSAQYIRENVIPSNMSPIPQIIPLGIRPFNFETISDPNNAPTAMHPSTKAKSEGVPCSVFFTKIGNPTIAGPIIKKLLIKVIIIIQKIGFSLKRYNNPFFKLSQ